jgi:hypothetical protein
MEPIPPRGILSLNVARLPPSIERCVMTDTRTLVIGVLAIAVLLLGYQYYEQQQRTIKIELPKVEIGKP